MPVWTDRGPVSGYWIKPDGPLKIPSGHRHAVLGLRIDSLSPIGQAPISASVSRPPHAIISLHGSSYSWYGQYSYSVCCAPSNGHCPSCPMDIPFPIYSRSTFQSPQSINQSHSNYSGDINQWHVRTHDKTKNITLDCNTYQPFYLSIPNSFANNASTVWRPLHRHSYRNPCGY